MATIDPALTDANPEAARRAGHQPARSTAVLGAVAVLVVAAWPMAGSAQIRGSERAMIRQQADGTTLTIDYGRPHVRGREPVFGGLIEWGHVWTPGANWATSLAVDNDVTINGTDVPEGRYSVWMVPSEGPWEVILDPRDSLYHTQPPDRRADQVRFRVTPETGPPTEALTFDVPLVEADAIHLRFRWGTVAIPFRIEVPPSRSLTVAADVALAYVGEYEVTFEGPPPPGAPPGAGPPTMGMVIEYRGDRLEGAILGGPPNLPSTFVLIPAADHVFNPAWTVDGVILETEVDMYFEFAVTDGRAATFDVRGLEDRLMMSATRR